MSQMCTASREAERCDKPLNRSNAQWGHSTTHRLYSCETAHLRDEDVPRAEADCALEASFSILLLTQLLFGLIIRTKSGHTCVFRQQLDEIADCWCTSQKKTRLIELKRLDAEKVKSNEVRGGLLATISERREQGLDPRGRPDRRRRRYSRVFS